MTNERITKDETDARIKILYEANDLREQARGALLAAERMKADMLTISNLRILFLLNNLTFFQVGWPSYSVEWLEEKNRGMKEAAMNIIGPAAGRKRMIVNGGDTQ